MKQEETIGVLESLLPEDFAKDHVFPPGWGGRFSKTKEASTEVSEFLAEFVAKQQSSAKARKPQKESVEWLESVWNDEALQRNKWGKWVLECAQNPDELRPRVKALREERAAKQRELEEKKKREEEEAERQRLEAEARREARRKRAEERKRQEEEEAERQRLEEEARREERRKKAEERKKRKEEEEERQRLEEEARREARRKRAEERKRLKEEAEKEGLAEPDAEASLEAKQQEQERREAERKKKEEEKAEKQRLAAEQAEARREAQRQKQEALEAARKKREEEKAERQRLAEQAAEERREARRRLLAEREAEQRRMEEEEAARVRREELEEKRRELDQRWAENAARRKQQAMENQKVVWTYVIGVGIAIALLFGLWVISRGFDVPLAKTGLVWPWSWWHIKFIIGLGVVLNIILLILVISTHPGARNTISPERYKEIGSPRVIKFVVVCVVITLGMFIYALCHLFSALGFSVRALGVGLLFLVEFPVVGMIGLLSNFLCNGLLWGNYEE